MVLGKLPVLGRPTIWITVGLGPTALAAGGGCLDIFYSHLSYLSSYSHLSYLSSFYPISPLSPCLWETEIRDLD